MKKIVAITVIFALVLLSGCGKKAEPIEIPENDTITGVQVLMTDGVKVDISDADGISAVTEAIE